MLRPLIVFLALAGRPATSDVNVANVTDGSKVDLAAHDEERVGSPEVVRIAMEMDPPPIINSNQVAGIRDDLGEHNVNPDSEATPEIPRLISSVATLFNLDTKQQECLQKKIHPYAILVQTGKQGFVGLNRWLEYFYVWSQKYPELAEPFPRLTCEPNGLVKAIFSKTNNNPLFGVARLVLRDLTQYWLDDALSPAKVYDRLGLAKVQLNGNFFTGPRYNELEKYVSHFNHGKPKEEQESAISVLVQKLPTGDLVTMLQQADKSEKTINLARELNLILNKKVADGLVEYDLVKKELDSQYILVESLKVDLVISRMESPDSAEDARYTLQAMIVDWSARNLSPAFVYQIFGLNEIRLAGFQSPRYVEWEKYLELYNTGKPKEEQESAMSVLVQKLPTGELVTMLQQADKSEKTINLARELNSILTKKVAGGLVEYGLVKKELGSLYVLVESLKVDSTFSRMESPDSAEEARYTLQAMIFDWSAQNLSPAIVYKIFGLDEVQLAGFQSPRYVEWEKYLEMDNAGKSNEEQESAISVLIQKLPTGKLVTMLQQADKSEKTLSLSRDLYSVLQKKVSDGLLEYDLVKTELDSLYILVESLKVDLAFSRMESPDSAEEARHILQAMIVDWSAQNLSPAIVYHLLGLNEIRLAGFQSPRYVEWEKYLEMYNTGKPNEEQESAMSVLVQKLPTGELVTMLQQADKSEKTINLAKGLYSILHKKVPVGFVEYDLVKTELDSLYILVESLKVDLVISRMESPDSAEDARHILQAMIVDWSAQNLSPAFVYHFYGLNEVQLAGFQSPRYVEWEKYLEMYNAGKPKEEQESAMSVLVHKLPTGELVTMLQQADKSEKTINLAKGLYSVLQKKVSDGLLKYDLVKTELDSLYILVESLKVDLAFSRMESPDSAKDARYTLQDMIFDWSAQNLSPAIVYHFYGLNEVQLAGFQSPRYVEWEKYLEMYNAGKSNKEQESAMSVLVQKLPTGELVTMLQQADKSEKTVNLARDLNSILTKKVAGGLVEYGLVKKELDSQFILVESLKVDLAFSRMESPDSAEEARYTLQAMIVDWSAQNLSPAIVYHFYGLNEVQLAGFQSPRYVEWEKYLEMYNAGKPKEEQESAMSVLIQKLPAGELVTMLQQADKSEKTINLAKGLYSFLDKKVVEAEDLVR